VIRMPTNLQTGRDAGSQENGLCLDLGWDRRLNLGVRLGSCRNFLCKWYSMVVETGLYH